MTFVARPRLSGGIRQVVDNAPHIQQLQRGRALSRCARRSKAVAARLAYAPPAVVEETTTSTSGSQTITLNGPLHLNFRLPAVPEKRDPPTFVRTKGRVVALGDLHGDFYKAAEALWTAGVAYYKDGKPIWCGEDTVVVQLGDVFDRGDCEIGIVMMLRDLHEQAQQQGGAVFMLNGNHESLNVCGDFRFVTQGAFQESARVAGLPYTASDSEVLRARMRLFAPGGLMARELAKNPTVLVVNDTVFAHGGLLSRHVRYGIDRINAEVAAWMRADIMPNGQYAMPPWHAMGDSNSVMWNRVYGKSPPTNPMSRLLDDISPEAQQLNFSLRTLGCERLVIGHTPQMFGANALFGDKVWRMDVGMSSGVLDAPVAVLEISPPDAIGRSVVNVLTSDTHAEYIDEPHVVDRVYAAVH